MATKSVAFAKLLAILAIDQGIKHSYPYGSVAKIMRQSRLLIPYINIEKRKARLVKVKPVVKKIL